MSIIRAKRRCKGMLGEAGDERGMERDSEGREGNEVPTEWKEDT